MSSTPITHLVSFLTRPLVRAHKPATVVALQAYLNTALVPLDSSSQSTLFLSPRCPAPPALQKACIIFGVRWADWIRLLSASLDVQVFVSAASFAVRLGTMPRRVLWVAPSAEEASKLASWTSIWLSPRAVRPHRGAALNPTRIPTSLSACTSASDIEADSECDSESDSEFEEYECESDSGGSSTSASSFASASSTSSSAHSFSKPAACYTYNGGVTHVVSGGVMLGSAPKPMTPSVQKLTPTRTHRRSATQSSSLNSALSWRRAA